MASCELEDKNVEKMEKKARNVIKACIKCKESKGGALIRNLVYCKGCLQTLVLQKFKKSIEETINSDKAPLSTLAIAFSGGLGSTLLLELVATTLCASNSRRSRRYRWEKVHVIFIDDSIAFNTIDDGPKPIADIDSIVGRYSDLCLTKVPIEKAFDPSGTYGVSAVEALGSYLKGLPTRTAVKDSIQLLKRRLIEDTAKSLGITHILLGRTLSSLSTALLSGICSGRGFTISEERQTISNGIISFNPLKDVGSKECALWVWWAGLQVASSSILKGWNNSTTSSVMELTRAFIAGLDHDYPSTVSTIVKTCAKVVPRDAPAATCGLCARRMQDDNKLAAIRDLVAITSLPNRKAAVKLCYACQTMLRSGNSRTIVTNNPEKITLPFSSKVIE